MAAETYSRPFTHEEYDDRLGRTKRAMERAGFDLLVLASPANMCWLTGYDGWSFYVPQAVIVHQDAEPVWFGRTMDANAARITTSLSDGDIVPYPDFYVHNPERHAMDFLAEEIGRRGWGSARIGLEMDADYFTARAYEALRAGLPNARFGDNHHLVNWERLVKSPAEVDLIRTAARIVERAMDAAFDAIAPGTPQNEAVAAIYEAQILGIDGAGGDYTAICPMLPTGEGTGTPHLTWTDRPFQTGEATIIEIAGARQRYHCPLARTVQLGPPPERLTHAADVVVEAMSAVLETARPGVACEDVEAAWRKVISAHGLERESRIGYPFGLAYPPDWGEHTASLRKGEKTEFQSNMCFHMMLGIWGDGWGVEISEPVVITDRGTDCLCTVPRKLIVKD